MQQSFEWVLSRRAELLEGVIVFALAMLVFALQNFVFGPMLSLLFDSQGYLWITQSCHHALRPENLAEVFKYFLGGCSDDVLRTAIVSHIPGILDLQKSGPLLPGILLLVYGVNGKSLFMANWQTGCWAMIFSMSLTVLGIWVYARSLAGTAAGRIAALLAISYSGFIANSGRILSEMPATCISIFAIFFVHLYAKLQEQKRQQMLVTPDELREEYKAAQSAGGEFPTLEELSSKRKANRFSSKELLHAFFPGVFAGLLMLGRPTLLPWPGLIAFCLLIVSLVSHNKRIFYPAAILSFFLGVSIFLVPWAMTRQVLSGAPSIMIERYGPYNLSQGMNLRTDGFDALPSQLVAHPEQFEKSSGEVLKSIITQFTQRPAAFVHLLMRKPARMIDSPWNDFQVKTLGVPMLAQRFEHQLILLAAVLGIVMLLEHGRKRPDYVLLANGLLIGVFLCFHLVACAFITMSRYFITAMPAAIVAASYFIAYLMKPGRDGIKAIPAVIFAPLFSMLLYYLLVPGYGRISELSVDLGLAQTSLLAALLMSAALAFGVLVPAFTVFRGARSKLLLCTFAFVGGAFCFVTFYYQFMCSEAVMKLGAVDREKMEASITIPAGTNCTRWYLVLDANDASTHSTAGRDRGILSGLRLLCNGREFKPDWVPLLNLDSSMRAESMYLAAFAYSSKKRCQDFRQWICAALPPENIVSPGENKFEFSIKGEDTSRPKIFADFCDPLGKRIHTVSLRSFSWSKGFFVDCPGEMRMDEWPEDSKNSDFFTLAGQASRLKARAFLLGVQDNIPNEVWVKSIPVPDQHIDSRTEKKMATFDYVTAPLLKELGSSPEHSMRIRVSGQLKASGAPTRASICLLEEYEQGSSALHEFAPLAPQVLEAGEQWRDFAFEDFVQPVRAESPDFKPLSIPSKLKEIKIHFLARPWWEVLDYGAFKGKGAIDFRNLKIELSGQATLNLAKHNCRWFELESQFAAK